MIKSKMKSSGYTNALTAILSLDITGTKNLAQLRKIISLLALATPSLISYAMIGVQSALISTKLLWLILTNLE